MDLRTCTANEYINGDNELPVCDEMQDDWDDQFISNLAAHEDEEQERVLKTMNLTLSLLL